MKFVASFSGGKDSTFAIYKAIKEGMTPIGMITTCPVGATKTWFHKLDFETLYQISDSIQIPITIVQTTGEDYLINFEKALTDYKQKGADAAIFGDIDIEGHLEWCTKRCESVGLKPYFPLWKQQREKVVRDFIDAGFKAKIVSARDERLQKGFLGEILTHNLINKMASLGVDVCGENGEYHTVVIDGPLFSKGIEL